MRLNKFMLSIPARGECFKLSIYYMGNRIEYARKPASQPTQYNNDNNVDNVM